jgi:hypothetical protein
LAVIQVAIYEPLFGVVLAVAMNIRFNAFQLVEQPVQKL